MRRVAAELNMQTHTSSAYEVSGSEPKYATVHANGPVGAFVIYALFTGLRNRTTPDVQVSPV